MKLQGRNLKIKMKGEDVKLLHKELGDLGYKIPKKEIEQSYFGKGTQKAVLQLQEKHGLQATGVVDEKTAGLINEAVDALQPRVEQCVVKGQVRYADGRPVAGILVKAYDKDMRFEEMLGERQTNKEGFYEIFYTSDKFTRAEKESADLLVKVFYGKGQEIAKSDIRFNAKQEETIDITLDAELYRGPSEYERYVAELTPLKVDVNGKPIPFKDLTDEDISFLSGETGISIEHLYFLKLDDDYGRSYKLPPAVFYGLFRQGLPTNLRRLLSEKPSRLRQTLKASIEQNLIPGRLEENLDDILEALHRMAVELSFQPSENGETPGLGELVQTALIDQRLKGRFVDAYARHEGPIEAFWQALRENPDFTDEGAVEELQLTLQLGTLTQNHVTLVNLLQARRQNGALQSTRDLARLDTDDWLALINTQVGDGVVGVPPDTPGEDDSEKAKNYVTSMVRLIEDAFPTVIIAHKIEKDIFPNKDNLVRFFKNNPEFEFESTTVHRYLAENPNALENLEAPETLTTQLKGMQRVFRLAPSFERYETLRVLMGDALDSAQAISRKGEEPFVREYADRVGGEARARAIYHRAEHVSALTLNIFATFGRNFHIGTPTVISNPSDDLEEVMEGVDGTPDLRTLFGSLDFCECEHCRSVYSPAAYLVDLLAFLRRPNEIDQDGAETGRTGLDVLFERRPEIGDIELSCENTNTPIPYVDLVNEVMENAVVGEVLPYQTTGTSEERRANPEHLRVAAYDYKLALAYYPWHLPFDLWTEEARVYLEHLGVYRYQLMEAFQTSGARPRPNDTIIANEYLHLTDLELRIIIGALDAPPSPWEFWGLDETVPLRDLESPDRTVELNWIEALSRVPLFLEKSGLSFVELLELLKTDFINPDDSIQVDLDESDTCNLEMASLTNLTSDALDKIHRFLRLQRKLHWTIRELSKTITALSGSRLNNGFLRSLSHVHRLQADLRIPLIEMLSWWGQIDTHGDAENPSLYQRVFQNETVVKRYAPETDPFLLNANKDQLETVGRIKEHVPAILAALEISDADLSLLTQAEITDNRLNLTNLSHLYRSVSFAKALHLSIRDFLSVKALTGINPFDGTNPQETRRFVETVRKVRESDYSIAELDYLLRHIDRMPGGVAPTKAGITLLLDEVRKGLRAIAAENTYTPDPTGEITRSKLSLLLEEDMLQTAIVILEDTGQRTPEKRTEQRTFIASGASHFADFLDVMEAQDKLVGTSPDFIEEKVRRFEYILEPLLNHLRLMQSENFVKQKLSDVLKLETSIVSALLTDWVASPDNPTTPALSEFLSPDFVAREEEITESDLETPDLRPLYRTFVLLDKIATAIMKFDIKHDELSWLFAHSPGLGWLDLNALPTQAEAPPVPFTGWERLANLFVLRDGLPPGEPTLFEILDVAINVDSVTDAPAIAEAEVLKKLSDRTGWSLEELHFLVSERGLRLTFPDDYRGEQWLVRLKTCFELMKRLGVSAEAIRGWIDGRVSYEAAREIKNAVKAKYDEKLWLNVAKPLRDELREKQRVALASYLVGNREEFQDGNDLYAYFLIDVEMTSCMMTSRIKQAISSVQLFVQRCLMNLEPTVKFLPSDVRQWKWMKNYRVWEANRKVFLYPENWIEPELRDNKSPFFENLENELLQNEVRQDTVETAFLHYLEKLDAVARLEIAGMYHQLEKNSEGEATTDILHVFGRTPGIPHIYYYRQRIDSSYWTPWERVDLDIEGNHLIPVIWNRRLYLFWPIFTEKAVDSDVPERDEARPPTKYWEIQLAWSEYKNGKWMAKKITSQPTKDDESHWPKEGHLFKPIIGRDELSMLWGYVTIGHDDFAPATPNRVHFIKRFRFAGCNEEAIVEDDSFVTTVWPRAKSIGNMMLAEAGEDSLYLPEATNTIEEGIVLKRTPGTFRLLYSHQYGGVITLSQFFFQDNMKTFFVLSKERAKLWETFRQPELLHPKITGDPVFRGALEDVNISEERRSESVTTLNPTDGVMTSDGLSVDIMPLSRDLEVVDVVYAEAPKIQIIGLQYLFQTFYHPYVCEFIKKLNRYGIDALLQRGTQQIESPNFFKNRYRPDEPLLALTGLVALPYPRENVDFTTSGAYSVYNWELFFHAPFLIAVRLSQNQRFEEAQQWFHYVFDPTDVSDDQVPARFWKVLPFYNNKPERIQTLMILLGKRDGDLSREERERKANIIKQIEQWRKQPFNPHLIARLRLTAYQTNVVMKYIDNLIAWGDQLFRRDTIESTNEATQLYILAAQILGDQPEQIPERNTPVRTFRQLEPRLDQFSNALIDLETALSESATEETEGLPSETGSSSVPLPTLYFCIPANEKLLKYWDIVADRLFKIRHCKNIEGVVRQLPLFEPPIDPALLVRAAAAGVDISSALSDLYAPLPHYRFSVMLQKATELCADVRQLGAALLSTLEKRDAEELALLRSSQEITLLGQVRLIKEQQIEEAVETRDGLQKTKDITTIRRNYYRDIDFMNTNERVYVDLTIAGTLVQVIGQMLEIAASSTHPIPEAYAGAAGWAGSPLVFSHVAGGSKAAAALQAFGSSMGMFASLLNTFASLSSVMGGHERRWDEWKLQEQLADKELEQIDKQIAAANIRLEIAKQDMKNHDQQIVNAQEVDAYMRDKFTNRELYDWMVSQISAIYFQSYQMAYDLARRAEKAFKHELGVSSSDTNFVKFGYWDSLKKGLLAGEKLHYDLKRMEVAYLEQNKREYEITKHISVAMLDPIALVKLKETGECFVNLPEAIFDLDYPGHYMRRIKSVSLTIPCVTGPYTSVNCTLALQGNRIRKSTNTDPQYGWTGDFEDNRFIYNVGAIQSIATSNAQNDSGVFELSFRDERYLPFEGAGAISSWHLELSGKWTIPEIRASEGMRKVEFPQLDFDTISDVIFHVKYMAREGGNKLKQAAIGALESAISEMTFGEHGERTGLFRIYSARHEFPSQWHKFLHPTETATSQVLQLVLTSERFPFLFKGRTININKVELLMKLKDDFESSIGAGIQFELTHPSGTAPLTLNANHMYGGLLNAIYPSETEETVSISLGEWSLHVTNIPTGLASEDDSDRLNPDAIEDIFIVCHYSVTG